MLVQVGVLPARHLVAIEVGRGRQLDAFKRRVKLADGLPVIGQPVEGDRVEPRVAGSVDRGSMTGDRPSGGVET